HFLDLGLGPKRTVTSHDCGADTGCPKRKCAPRDRHDRSSMICILLYASGSAGPTHFQRRQLVGDGLAERAAVGDAAGLPLAVRQGQLREHQLGEAIRLLEMRVAGEDERVDAELHIFLDALGDRIRIADQRRARSATDEADTGPQVWTDLEVLAAAAVQR